MIVIKITFTRVIVQSFADHSLGLSSCEVSILQSYNNAIPYRNTERYTAIQPYPLI